MTAIDTAFSGISDTNRQLYLCLKRALMLGLRRQIFIAVCDDLYLRRAIAGRLQTELAAGHSPEGDLCLSDPICPRGDRAKTPSRSRSEGRAAPPDGPKWVTLNLDPSDPDPVAQMLPWKTRHQALGETPPVGFQILGVERLTRQPAAIQWSFLNHLRTVGRRLSEFDCSILLWLSSPWLGCIQQSAPEFWRWRADLFEFVGDPTPSWDERSRPATLPKTRRSPDIEPSPERSPPSLENCVERSHFYRDRVRSGTASVADLEGGIEACERILIGLETGELVPENGDDSSEGRDRVDLWNDLGTFHWMRFQQTLKSQGTSSDDAISHLEQSIIFYQKALMKIDPETSPAVYVKLLKNLGAAHTDLAPIREPVENLQQSVTAYEEAIRILRSSRCRGLASRSDGVDLIAIQNNLGTAHWNLAQHVRPVVHLNAAIAAYTEALLGYNPDREPMHYAMIQTNLSTACWNLAQHQPSKQLLQRAIDGYRQALKYRTPATAPLACTTTQNNLGTACWHLAIDREDPEDRMKFLKEAIVAYETALALARQLSPTELTFDTLATHNNLGLAHYRLATDRSLSLTQAERVSHLEMALHHHLIAGWPGQSPPRDGSPPPPGKSPLPESGRHRVAFDHLVRTLRAFYRTSGWQGQNRALSRIPGHLLPDILRSL